MRGGGAKKSGGQESQALGRSRGGFSTKIHIAVDALGNPLRLLLTAGQRHDSPQAGALIEGFERGFTLDRFGKGSQIPQRCGDPTADTNQYEYQM